MHRFNFLYFIILYFVGGQTHPQQPHISTNTACNTHFGTAEGVAVIPNGTVFLANTDEGIPTYNYSGFISIDEKNYTILQIVNDTAFLAKKYKIYTLENGLGITTR